MYSTLLWSILSFFVGSLSFILPFLRGLHCKIVFRMLMSNARRTAEILLKWYYLMKAKYPDLSNDDIYIHVLQAFLSDLPQEKINRILESAKEVTEQKSPLKFQTLVHTVIIETDTVLDTIPWLDSFDVYEIYISYHSIIDSIIPNEF